MAPRCVAQSGMLARCAFPSCVPPGAPLRPLRPRCLRRAQGYGLGDLVALSVASTVGSGVFSLAGRVASQEAGPAVVLSLGIGALGCLLSAAAYAELSSRVVAAGSVYAYAQEGPGDSSLLL